MFESAKRISRGRKERAIFMSVLLLAGSTFIWTEATASQSSTTSSSRTQAIVGNTLHPNCSSR